MLTKEPCDDNLVSQIDLSVVKGRFVIPIDTFQMNITVMFLTENEQTGSQFVLKLFVSLVFYSHFPCT